MGKPIRLYSSVLGVFPVRITLWEVTFGKTRVSVAWKRDLSGSWKDENHIPCIWLPPDERLRKTRSPVQNQGTPVIVKREPLNFIAFTSTLFDQLASRKMFHVYPLPGMTM